MTSLGDTKLICAHFRAIVCMCDADSPLVIRAHEANSAMYDIVCTAWRLTPTQYGCDGSPTSSERKIEPNEIFSQRALMSIHSRNQVALAHTLRSDPEEMTKWHLAPPALDVDDKNALTFMEAYYKTIEDENLQSFTRVCSGNVHIDRNIRRCLNADLCLAIILGKVDEEVGWGFISDISRMVHLDDMTRVSEFPHMKRGKLVYKTCMGPVISQSAHSTTHVACETLVVKVIGSPREVKPSRKTCSRAVRLHSPTCFGDTTERGPWYASILFAGTTPPSFREQRSLFHSRLNREASDGL